MSEEQTRPTPHDLKQYDADRNNAYAEQRVAVELATGQALTDVYERFADHIVRDDVTGFDTLNLYMPWKDEAAKIEVQSRTDDQGNRTANMSFSSEHAWSNHWQYTDGPNQVRKLAQCYRNPETGEYTPMPKPDASESNPDPVDPTSNFEVAFWGKNWPQNLAAATPEKPKPNSRFKGLGKKAVKAVFLSN